MSQGIINSIESLVIDMSRKLEHFKQKQSPLSEIKTGIYHKMSNI